MFFPASRHPTLSHVLLCAALIFGALHFVHLRADYPGLWPESAVITDEGWYGHAAFEAIANHSWFVPGDFNPVVATPLFPVMEAALFRFTGVSISAARALEVCFFLVAIAAILALLSEDISAETAAWTLTLFLTSFFLFSMSRIAILKAPAIAALSLASYCAKGNSRFSVLREASLGAALLAAVLVKSSSAFAVPAILYLVFTRRQKLAGRAACLAIACGILAIGSSAYIYLVRHPHAADYQYFVTTIVRARIHSDGFARSFAHAALNPFIYNPAFAFIVSVCLFWVLAADRLRNRWLNFSLLWMGCYVCYLSMVHYAPPRYYIALLPPSMILCALALQRSFQLPSRKRILLALMLGLMIFDGARIVRYLSRPTFAFVSMADDVRRHVEADGRPRAVVLGHFTNTLSMISGVQSINSEFGPKPLQWRLERFRPSYYVGQPGQEAEVLDLLRQRYNLQEVAHYVIYSDARVVLYRLDPM